MLSICICWSITFPLEALKICPRATSLAGRSLFARDTFSIRESVVTRESALSEEGMIKICNDVTRDENNAREIYICQVAHLLRVQSARVLRARVALHEDVIRLQNRSAISFAQS